MAKLYKCSNCGEVLVLGESLFGRKFNVFCPKCKKMATFNIKEI
jgi:phage FluMu protein Com